MSSRLLARAGLATTLFAATAAGSDRLLVASFLSDDVVRFDHSTGALLDELVGAPLNGVLGCALGPDGALYVCSELTDQVLRYDVGRARFLDVFVADDPLTPQDETGGLDGPAGIVFRPNGNALVCSFDTDQVLEYEARTGAFVGVFVDSGAGNGNLNGPDAGLTFGPDGNLYVPSFFNNRVKRFDGQSGAFIDNFVIPATSGLANPRTVVFPGDGFLYVTSEGNDRVIRCDATDGTFVDNFVWNDPAVPGDETGGLDAPSGMAFGPDGRLWVASLNTDAVLRYDAATGAFVDEIVSSSSGINAPTFLLFTPKMTKFCPSTPNSFAPSCEISATGFGSAQAAALALTTFGSPPGKLVTFLQSGGFGTTPLGDGTLCLQAPTWRLGPVPSDAFGRASLPLDFSGSGNPFGPIFAGSVFTYQAVFRDPAGPGGGQLNLSDGLLVEYGP